MLTFQDYQNANDKLAFIQKAIYEYRSGETFQQAMIADDYEAQKNRTIYAYTKYLYSSTGVKMVDTFSSNNKIASNLFHRLNTQRCSYLLGNGVFFEQPETKKALGKKFDKRVFDAGYYALIHGVSYGFWNKDQLYVFPATEFCPLWDDYSGKLMAGIRFWSMDWDTKPVVVELYEEDGMTIYRTKMNSKGLDLEEYRPKRGYIEIVQHSEADGDEIAGYSNYGSLPIVPIWGGKHKQSTIVGLRPGIDSYDLIKSGFANDLQDCAEIYWLISNNFGMDEEATQKFMDKLKLQHVANVDKENSAITPYTQNIPTEAKTTYLDLIRNSLYEDFGALDVTKISAGAKTATEIKSAYQPLDEEADDFENQVTEFIEQLLVLINIEDTPTYQRNMIVNQSEQTQMVMQAADHLDEETLLTKLPWITNDEVKKILKNKEAEAKEEQQEQENQQKQENQPVGFR